jgi:hypothetical protein
MRRANVFLLLATLAGRYLDAATTYMSIWLVGAQEANPFMRTWLCNPPALFFLQTLGGIAMWLILHLAGRVVGGWFQRAAPWLAVALSWTPVVNNLLTLAGYSPLAILYVR